MDVNCGVPGKAGSINAMLGKLDPAGPNVVIVHSNCRENVVINGFDRLTLRAAAGAQLSDASSGNEWGVIEVINSRRIKIRDFKIVGGQVGVVCIDSSYCQFVNNSVEGQSQNGFSINDSEAIFAGDAVRNTAGPGIYLNRSKAQLNQVTMEHNGTGLTLGTSTAVGVGVNASNNSGAGIFVATGSNLQLIDSQVMNNGQNGIQATAVSTLSLTNDTVTGNTYSGVWLSDMTTAYFVGGTYLNNAMLQGLQVECAPYYTVVSNLWSATVGATNCSAH